jgi:hypothetical protein
VTTITRASAKRDHDVAKDTSGESFAYSTSQVSVQMGENVQRAYI